MFLALLGGFDNGLEIFMICLGIDYVTGVISAYKQGVLCPAIGYKGILNKFGLLILIMLSVQMDKLLRNQTRTHDMIMYFVTINEMISIVGNLNKIGVPVPSFIVNALRGGEIEKQ
jgi:toxin secretion/phage lysis holin